MTAAALRPAIRVPAFVMLCLSLLLTGCGYNRIPTLEEGVNAAWAEVENQYKRRADLIPNLVEVVKGYAAHENDTLTAVVEARAKATSVTLTTDQLGDPAAVQRFEEGQGELSRALGRLLMVTENYPDLKANQNFITLQAQLEGTENRITIARRDYIQAVQAYNVAVRTFPGVIWAKIQGASPKETFRAPAGSENAPAVKF